MYACKKQIRIVYSVVENVLFVNIIAIGKREDMEVYKTASERVWKVLSFWGGEGAKKPASVEVKFEVHFIEGGLVFKATDD